MQLDDLIAAMKKAVRNALASFATLGSGLAEGGSRPDRLAILFAPVQTNGHGPDCGDDFDDRASAVNLSRVAMTLSESINSSDVTIVMHGEPNYITVISCSVGEMRFRIVLTVDKS